MTYELFIQSVIVTGQIGWAAAGVVLIVKLPNALRNWIVAKADREREICEALKQLRPNGGESLMDKINAIERKLSEHILEAEADRQKLEMHLQVKEK